MQIQLFYSVCSLKGFYSGSPNAYGHFWGFNCHTENQIKYLQKMSEISSLFVQLTHVSNFIHLNNSTDY